MELGIGFGYDANGLDPIDDCGSIGLGSNRHLGLGLGLG